MRNHSTQEELKKINSATKYPSILTYHTLLDRGMLSDEVTEFDEMVILTEKVDGTNARIILLPGGDFLIGSREELLTAAGDRVTPQKPPEQKAIVDTLLPLAERLVRNDDMITTFYLEVYGGKVGVNAKQYSKSGTLGYRLFDISMVSMDTICSDIGEIAAWREKDGQSFLDEDQLVTASRMHNIPLVPRLSAMHKMNLPTGLEETHKWLGEYLDKTNVALDDTAEGKPEGIVLRDPYRKIIRKARFADYTSTIKRRK